MIGRIYMEIQNLTEQQAIDLYNSNFWETLSNFDRVQFQLFTERLCMPFDIYHKALEIVLKRAVFIHELVISHNLQQEFLGETPPPTLENIINLIPVEKRMIVHAYNPNN